MAARCLPVEVSSGYQNSNTEGTTTKSLGSTLSTIAVQMCFPCSVTAFGHGGGQKGPIKKYVILGASVK
ncbi:hypothetical protein SNOG_08411 [Parastagonospora nodorum SN15]|uniref:Uncharacterized protein n=1 Tax=Phaeosphaeria nodorum (strain SN15 / ATCC MYA-4574 / FGSC 10173) TaxID=321614 RepID=Q0UIK3_PHANO|nr:hypothetical protein SNOG_08411 [Parastagonospora nodorum SN15]EAT84687.1 hypothetical protein SNOG_08411 [Parastagonospora nodorum SN15]